ncbi:tRNA (adenosine(37)-N6)-threonylcarbamoyltransferase complex ATPase subunit type 1 TsaE [Phaeobacter sp. J2-8]|uniref:tRNA (adenosine(37)-N6)-threonylcarbamoyltransferase complex ATPase subunit type 1 TsaE n=1 Tax=Phaeobacter sp. J2-8 TaxID=2931394 RepID=UPI001FD44784|nr:tRNA (adenosine(37)-N6)-threonylcarbamoyltransferase complex ATPase subunit type 1 TsaE [Phaeobacter sp. J2-8]MCJ7875064.1 tRNA (adenosine(37)-N6)-threonylcarbamoyltransferase complex ATPase subunit type 1 TsaE [Phaeobacter sp. J2-8]
MIDHSYPAATAQIFALSLPSPEATCELAARIAPRLAAGDVLLLRGDIGAGKTHFCRCLIRSLLTEAEDVPSPTFTLVQTYPAPVCEIWHADLYRLGDLSEVDELGLTEAFDTAICLIEWPDRLGSEAPANALTLEFSTDADPDTRHLTLSWSAPRWDSLPKVIAA